MNDPAISWLEDRIKVLADHSRLAAERGDHDSYQLFQQRLVECEDRLQIILHRYQLTSHPLYRESGVH